MTVQQRLYGLRGALQAIDPDVLVVVEGPSRSAELDLFFQQFGAGTWVTHLQETRSVRERGTRRVANGKSFDVLPISNNVTQREWIDHLLLGQRPRGDAWVTEAKVLNKLGGQWFDAKLPHASDHVPIVATVRL